MQSLRGFLPSRLSTCGSPSAKTRLKGVNLRVAAGHDHGHPGRLRLGQVRPDEAHDRPAAAGPGQGVVDGEDVVPLTGRELDRVRRKFGMVFQSAALFDSMTVGDNVAFPSARAHASSANRVARVVAREARGGGAHRASRTASPAELSGGMRKRVGLARAIGSSPRSSCTTSRPPGSIRSPPTTSTR